MIMKLITTLTVILSLSEVQSQSIFEQSPWDSEKERIVATYADRLNRTIPYWTNAPYNLLRRMIIDGILVNDANGDMMPDGESALARMFGFTVLTNQSEVLIKPTSCRADSFGIGGNFTDSVCDTVDVLEDICTNLEPGCRPDKLQNVVSASTVDFLQEFTYDSNGERVPEAPSASLERKRNLMKIAVCIDRAVSDDPMYTHAVTECYDYTNLPDDDDLGQRVANYYSAMIYVAEEEFYNPLWTNTASAAQTSLDPDACFVLGDGYLQLAEETFNAFELKPIKSLNSTKSAAGIYNEDPGKGHREQTYAKSVVVDTIVHQYIADEETSTHLTFNDADKDEFYKDVLHGYFYQKYASNLFPEKWERKMLMDGTNIRSPTLCAVPLGALLAAKCDVNATDIYDYTQYYFDNALGAQDTYTGEDVCNDPSLTYKECILIGGSGRDNACCTYNTTSGTCGSGIGTNICMTKYCKNFNREDLWKSKRTITDPQYYDKTQGLITMEDCFESVLGLVETTVISIT